MYQSGKWFKDKRLEIVRRMDQENNFLGLKAMTKGKFNVIGLKTDDLNELRKAGTNAGTNAKKMQGIY